jgi:mRNA-degrading endonuclease RelE of RelBE toxin-antitoxin system
MKIKYLKDFEKELKKLSKKYPSLKKDLDDFCEVLELDPT